MLRGVAVLGSRCLHRLCLRLLLMCRARGALSACVLCTCALLI